MEKCLASLEIKKLSVAERILMVQEIWDSIAAEQESLAVTEAQKTELDRRIASHDASPNEGRSWGEIKRRLKASK
jgi:putative addiction module component (TIGR02574 family)